MEDKSKASLEKERISIIRSYIEKCKKIISNPSNQYHKNKISFFELVNDFERDVIDSKTVNKLNSTFIKQNDISENMCKLNLYYHVNCYYPVNQIREIEEINNKIKCSYAELNIYLDKLESLHSLNAMINTSTYNSNRFLNLHCNIYSILRDEILHASFIDICQKNLKHLNDMEQYLNLYYNNAIIFIKSLGPIFHDILQNYDSCNDYQNILAAYNAIHILNEHENNMSIGNMLKYENDKLNLEQEAQDAVLKCKDIASNQFMYFQNINVLKAHITRCKKHLENQITYMDVICNNITSLVFEIINSPREVPIKDCIEKSVETKLTNEELKCIVEKILEEI